jgi:two-component system sensor histidine kinase TctE
MMTVSRRLLLLLLPGLTILMFGGGVLDYLMTVDATRGAYDHALGTTAVALAAYLHEQDGRLVLLRPGSDAGASGRFDNKLYAITGASGALVAGNAALAAATPQSPAAESFSDVIWQGQRLRVARVVTATSLGPVSLIVAETTERRSRTERAMLVGKLSVDFVVLDVALLLIWIAVHLGLSPLRRLHDQVESRGAREPQPFEESQVPGEVRPLVRAFNRLLALLHDAAASQRRFVADAAHQLRTPVAGLSAQLELLMQNPAAASVATELSIVQGGIARIAHSANQLLSLARTEPLSIQPEQFHAVALRPILEELVGRNIDRAEQLGLDLGAELQTASVTGDAWMLEDLTGNLLDNALKYTSRGGRVTLRCGLANNGSPYIEVEDDGPGIPETERHRVRERFYRRPGSAGAGCGLGLAIVDEIARVHGGQLTINAGAGGVGARMHVSFPAHAAV